MYLSQAQGFANAKWKQRRARPWSAAERSIRTKNNLQMQHHVISEITT
jgi:hypothetical protein